MQIAQPRVQLSSALLHGQPMRHGLLVAGVDSVMDGVAERTDIVEDPMSEMMRLDIEPDRLDGVESSAYSAAIRQYVSKCGPGLMRSAVTTSLAC